MQATKRRHAAAALAASSVRLVLVRAFRQRQGGLPDGQSRHPGTSAILSLIGVKADGSGLMHCNMNAYRKTANCGGLPESRFPAVF